jgi:hypothetical protein
VFVALAVVAMLGVLTAGVAYAVDVAWDKNGTTADGKCANNTADPAGTQKWRFILTSPDPAASSWQLTATFASSGMKTAPGDKQGNGSVHFFVETSFNDSLTAATATNGTASSVLTVSDCTSGTPTTTTTAPTTTTVGPSTTSSGGPGGIVVGGVTATQQPAAATPPRISFTG